jgi:hypothetical protein
MMTVSIVGRLLNAEKKPPPCRGGGIDDERGGGGPTEENEFEDKDSMLDGNGRPGAMYGSL